MSRKIILIVVLWMIVFTAATFLIGPIILAVAAGSQIVSEASLEHILLAWRFGLILSPLAALLLGLRGALPGTGLLAVAGRHAGAVPGILVSIVLIICSLFALIAWVALQPPAGRPDVSITFLGYTNDVAGTRLARIAVTNRDTSTVLAYQPVIEMPEPTAPGGQTNYNVGGNSPWHSVLDSSASDIFTVPAPTNQSPWRLRLLVYPDFGAARVFLKRVAGLSCLSVGIMPRYVRLPYDIEGDWIRSEK